jgi:hypothetical protein
MKTKQVPDLSLKPLHLKKLKIKITPTTHFWMKSKLDTYFTKGKCGLEAN